MSMEQLKACYERYIAAAEKVWKERSAWDGALGIGASSKDHPCHVEFFKAVENWVQDFLHSDPTQETAEAAITYVVQTSENYKKQFTYWTMFAAHGLMRPLVSLVSPSFAAEMRKWYDEHLPRKDRLPVHKDLYKLLKKRERA